MNTTLLIDALVRQTTVLLAALATTTGNRTPLSRVANQVFANLVSELKQQGLGNKVIADMFGMALRTYHHRMARLQESSTDRGRSLWEAVLTYVEDRGTVLRTDVLGRFSHDDGTVVRSILRDLVDSRLVFQTGRGDQTAYRAATDGDDAALSAEGHAERVQDTILLVAVHRYGPLTLTALGKLVPLPEAELGAALERLVADGRLVRDGTAQQALYRAEQVLVPVGDAAGWQGALFDHYQAVVTAMVTKLRRGAGRADVDDAIGGSTYHFDIWPGHPLEAEVMGLLRNFRRQAVALRTDVEEHNREHSTGGAEPRRVVTYVGQTVLEDEEHDDESA